MVIDMVLYFLKIAHKCPFPHDNKLKIISEMKILIGTAFIFTVINFQAWPQSYGTSLGLRFGNQANHRAIGLTGQHRLQKGLTLEGIMQSDFNNNTTLHGLVKKHNRLLTKRFNYYYGTGFSVGKEESWIKNAETREIIHTYGNTTLGMDLMVGIEMTLLKANISIDYKPNINLMGQNPWYTGQVGISFRTVLVKGSTQNKNKRQKARAKKRKNKSQEPFFKNIIQNVKETF